MSLDFEDLDDIEQFSEEETMPELEELINLDDMEEI
jgi:hypothetical protein